MLHFNTSPNEFHKLNRTLEDYKVKCPDGFVVPHDSNDRDVEWVEGTGCARAFRSPMWTSREWNAFDTCRIMFTYLNIVHIIFMMIRLSYLSFESSKWLFFITIMFNVQYIPSLVMLSKTWEDTFCRNNTVGYNSKDGFNFCSIQALVNKFLSNCSFMTLLIRSIDFYVQAVLRVRPCVPWTWQTILVFVARFDEIRLKPAIQQSHRE
jgi:hypothetical protein